MPAEFVQSSLQPGYTVDGTLDVGDVVLLV
jgi:hypothetical protein